MMTKKDFELIARVLRTEMAIAEDSLLYYESAVRMATIKRVAEAFATELRLTNPRFDSGRFLKACGVSSDG